MLPGVASFGVRETHGILLRAQNEILASSDERGWRSLYASTQREVPYEGYYDPVQDHLMVLHMDGPVRIDRSLCGKPSSRTIPAGGVHIVPGGIDLGVRLGGQLCTLHVYLRRAVLEEVASEFLVGDPSKCELLPRFGDCDQGLERLLMAVGSALEDSDSSSALYVDYLARAIAGRLICGHSTAQQSEEIFWRDQGGLGRRQLARAIGFMREHLDQSISLNAIADAAGLSPSHFARRFRTTLGVAPHQYLVQLRIERAKKLLAQSDLSIAEIAFVCGFSHQEHLTRLFKRHCDTTPAAYRKARRN